MPIAKFNRLSLSDSDIQYLRDLLDFKLSDSLNIKAKLPTVRLRALALLDFNAGLSVSQVALKYSLSRPTLYKLLNYSNLQSALFPIRPGRPKKN